MSYHIDSNDPSFVLPPEAVGGIGAYHIDSNDMNCVLPPEAVGVAEPSTQTGWGFAMGLAAIAAGAGALYLIFKR